MEGFRVKLRINGRDLVFNNITKIEIASDMGDAMAHIESDIHHFKVYLSGQITGLELENMYSVDPLGPIG